MGQLRHHHETHADGTFTPCLRPVICATASLRDFAARPHVLQGCQGDVEVHEVELATKAWR